MNIKHGEAPTCRCPLHRLTRLLGLLVLYCCSSCHPSATCAAHLYSPQALPHSTQLHSLS